LRQLEERIPWNDSMEVHYARLALGTLSRPVRSAYENLKAIGIDLITNDSLRFQIGSLYESQYPFNERIEQEFELPIRNSVLIPQLQKHVRTMSVRESAKPLVLEALYDDHEFQEAIRSVIQGQELVLWAYGETLEKINKLIESTKNALKNGG